MVLDVQFGTASCLTAYPPPSVRLSCLFPRAAAVVFLFEWPDELQYPIGLKLRAKWNKCGSILFCSLFAATKGFFNRKYIAKCLQPTAWRFTALSTGGVRTAPIKRLHFLSFQIRSSTAKSGRCPAACPTSGWASWGRCPPASRRSCTAT